jgi:hypothetical protein
LIQAVWQVNTTPWPVEVVGQDCAGSRAFTLLQRDHVRSDKLGSVCQRIAVGFCKEYETFLEMNPHRQVQGQACLGLGQLIEEAEGNGKNAPK